MPQRQEVICCYDQKANDPKSVTAINSTAHPIAPPPVLWAHTITFSRPSREKALKPHHGLAHDMRIEHLLVDSGACAKLSHFVYFAGHAGTRRLQY